MWVSGSEQRLRPVSGESAALQHTAAAAPSHLLTAALTHRTTPLPHIAACFAMPQAALFGLSVVMALVFLVLSSLFALIETGAGEPLSRNFLSLSSECGCWQGVV